MTFVPRQRVRVLLIDPADSTVKLKVVDLNNDFDGAGSKTMWVSKGALVGYPAGRLISVGDVLEDVRKASDALYNFKLVLDENEQAPVIPEFGVIDLINGWCDADCTLAARIMRTAASHVDSSEVEQLACEYLGAPSPAELIEQLLTHPDFNADYFAARICDEPSMRIRDIFDRLKRYDRSGEINP